MQFVKKRLLSLITAAALMVGMLPAAFAGYENFTSKTTYPAGQFTDVPSTEWYAQNVQAAYEYKLVDGVNATQFKPNSNLTIAQAIKLAACLHSTYVSGTTDFETARPWYQPYVTYALENGIINTTYADYDQPATRAQFASIFANALPEDALTAINDIADGAIAVLNMSQAMPLMCTVCTGRACSRAATTRMISSRTPTFAAARLRLSSPVWQSRICGRASLWKHMSA